VDPRANGKKETKERDGTEMGVLKEAIRRIGNRKHVTLAPGAQMAFAQCYRLVVCLFEERFKMGAEIGIGLTNTT
jgi:hypothetical protein